MASSAGDDRAVAIIGGGWAGMTAAVALADAGIPVRVFESARELGGRARAVHGAARTVDNGQHLLLGAYRDTLAMIHRVQPAGTAPAALYRRSPLDLCGPGDFRLRMRRLPAPFHALTALLGARGCTWGERLAVVRAFLAWQRDGWRAPAHLSVRDLLLAQPVAMVDRLWTPLCLAALNTPPGAASAQVFLNVVRDALAAAPSASDMIIPAIDLSQLFPEPAARYIAARGGTVHRGTMIRSLSPSTGGYRVQAGGVDRVCSRVVLATAPRQATRLLTAIPAAAVARERIDAYAFEPITTVYLQYPVAVGLPVPMVQLDGAPGQWVFEHAAATGGSRLAVVISTDGPQRALAHAALSAAVENQVRKLAGSALPRPSWTQVITERRATHACTPGRVQPDAGRIAPGLFLAGDHTDPDYPATLEAAVRSGLRVAASIVAET